MLSVLLIAAVPAQAGTIRFGDVIALATVNGQNGRQTIDLRLRSITQQGGTATQDRQTSSAGNNSQDPRTAQTPASAAPVVAADGGNITGTSVAVQQPGSVQVETIELGDIQGTICDCGEIPPLPGGGFPKLPLLALAGIPLLFLGGDDDIPPIDIVPVPTPPAPQVPEPATLLLLGSGLAALGAGARRRRRDAATANSGKERDEVLDVREV
jgi:hypothetical protein